MMPDCGAVLSAPGHTEEYLSYIEATGGGEYKRTRSTAAPGRCRASMVNEDIYLTHLRSSS
jgi:hypothetical protein